MLIAHPQVGVKHLMMGIIREGQGMAMTIQSELGADVKQMQVKLLEQLSIDQPPG
jgi:hypothetical protein